jgi:uncharacterized protein
MNHPGIIDVWAQRPGALFMSQPWLTTLNRWTGNAAAPPAEVPLEHLLRHMDEAGVEKSLLSAWWGPAGELISNDSVAEAVQRHPDRIVGIASVDLTRPMEAVRTLRRCVTEYGFKGLRVVPWLWNLPPDDRRYYPLYAACCELGVPFMTQIGYTGPLCPSEPGRPIPYLETVLLEFPDLVVVGGHVGFPWFDEVVALSGKFPNLHVDTSAYVAGRYPANLIEFMRGRGRDRVMFGTNYPMLTAKRCLAGLDALGLDEEARSLFLSGNARRVFRL